MIKYICHVCIYNISSKMSNEITLIKIPISFFFFDRNCDEPPRESN